MVRSYLEDPQDHGQARSEPHTPLQTPQRSIQANLVGRGCGGGGSGGGGVVTVVCSLFCDSAVVCSANSARSAQIYHNSREVRR
jgi:hypothetical protein